MGVRPQTDLGNGAGAVKKEIAEFFRTVMGQDSERAARCHQFLTGLSGTEEAGPAVS